MLYLDPSSFAAKDRLIPQDDVVPGTKVGGAVRCHAKLEIVSAALITKKRPVVLSEVKSEAMNEVEGSPDV